ncbi:uncharacterized protein [Triticum aestivum]|uniref:uncharacterized protein n=1 Tax=Triticum aestivum TaxID=4565 RepID=UPI001D0063EA|nr:uncharacterized protein LOC123123076 [Triticum aestivum]
MSDKLSLDEEIPIILLWCAALFWHSFYIITTVQTTWRVGKDVVDVIQIDSKGFSCGFVGVVYFSWGDQLVCRQRWIPLMVEQVGGNVAWCVLHIPAVFNSSSKAAVISAVFEDETSRPKAAAAVVALVATFIQRRCVINCPEPH